MNPNIWDTINNEDFDLWIWLGDNVYGKPNELDNLKKLYDKQKNLPAYQSILKKNKVFGIWDDHDYGPNDGDGSYIFKEKSKTLFLDFFDIPKSHPMQNRKGIYQSYSFIDSSYSILFLLLDVRSFKPKYFMSENPNQRYKQDLGGDLLGKDQWSWIRKNLDTKNYDIVIFCSGIQFLSSEHKYEKWENYPQSKIRLLELIKNKNIKNTIFLSGDRHIAEISEFSLDNNSSILDFTSSGLTHSYESLKSEKNKLRISPLITTLNFGTIQFNLEEKNIILSILDEYGKTIYQYTKILNL